MRSHIFQIFHCTLPETKIVPENRPKPKRKRSYSNHPLLVSGSVSFGLGYGDCTAPCYCPAIPTGPFTLGWVTGAQEWDLCWSSISCGQSIIRKFTSLLVQMSTKMVPGIKFCALGETTIFNSGSSSPEFRTRPDACGFFFFWGGHQARRIWHGCYST